MEDINGNEINEVRELGTKKYNIKINNRYLVDFKETKCKRGKGSYSGGVLIDLGAVPEVDIITTSLEKSNAKLIDGRFNLKSVMSKLLNNSYYKFYKIEIIELGD